jgi:hypothetical protein
LNKKERTLLWLGGYVGAVLSSLFDWIVSHVSVTKLPPQVATYATIGVWLLVFLALSYPLAWGFSYLIPSDEKQVTSREQLAA